jgi:hypothetical protein
VQPHMQSIISALSSAMPLFTIAYLSSRSGWGIALILH